MSETEKTTKKPEVNNKTEDEKAELVSCFVLNYKILKSLKLSL